MLARFICDSGSAGSRLSECGVEKLQCVFIVCAGVSMYFWNTFCIVCVHEIGRCLASFPVWLTWCLNVPEIPSSVPTAFLSRRFPIVLLLFLCLSLRYASWTTKKFFLKGRDILIPQRKHARTNGNVHRPQTQHTCTKTYG